MTNYLSSVANSKFGRLSTRISNAVILRDLVKKVYLRSSVVACLKGHVSDDKGINWWQDKALMKVFKNMYEAGVMPLPIDAVERIRWIALICIAVCLWEGFNYGNILCSLDYLPTNELDGRFGTGITDQIVKLREDLAKNGWEYVFEWKKGKQ